MIGRYILSFFFFFVYIPHQLIAILMPNGQRLNLAATRHIQLPHNVTGLLLQLCLQLFQLIRLRCPQQFLSCAVDLLEIFLLQLNVRTAKVPTRRQQSFGWTARYTAAAACWQRLQGTSGSWWTAAGVVVGVTAAAVRCFSDGVRCCHMTNGHVTDARRNRCVGVPVRK